MDIFALVAVIFIVLLGAMAVAAIMMQQNGQLRQIQDKLSKLSKGNEAPLNPEGLRIERAGIVDPLVLLEVSLGQSDSVELTEEQLQQIDVARSNIKKISEQLKSAEEIIQESQNANVSSGGASDSGALSAMPPHDRKFGCVPKF